MNETENVDVEPAAELSPVIIEADGKTLISLCDRSAIAVRPWAAAGFRVVCVDLESPAGQVDGVEYVRADVRRVAVRGRPAGVMAWPPCRDLATVGAAAWSRKGVAALIDALSIADACVRIAVRSRAAWWVAENPSGRLSHYWGPPDYVFSPCDYGGYLTPPGDAYTKRTSIWCGGSFVMPDPRPVAPVEGSLVARVENVDRRSETPRGFAAAVFLANAPAGERCIFDPAVIAPGPPIVKPTDRPCAWCGSTYAARRSDQLFCSTRCRVNAHRHK